MVYDPDKIEKFFLGNYAKVWAMSKGFVSHFKACDIIGFLTDSDSDDEVFEDLDARSDNAYAMLPIEPQLIHFGKL